MWYGGHGRDHGLPNNQYNHHHHHKAVCGGWGGQPLMVLRTKGGSNMSRSGDLLWTIVRMCN